MSQKKYNICKYTNYEKALLMYNKEFYNFIYEYKYLKYNHYSINYYIYSSSTLYNEFNEHFFDKNYYSLNHFNKITILCTLVYKLINVLNENKIYFKNNITKKFINKDNELRNIKIRNVMLKNCSYGIIDIYESHISQLVEYDEDIDIRDNNYYIHHNKTKEYTKTCSLPEVKKFLNLNEFKNNSFRSFKFILAEGLNKINEIIKWTDDKESDSIINIDELYLYYDLIHHKISYKIYDEKINNIFLNILSNKQQKFMDDFFSFLLDLIDWKYVFQDYKPCYYCGQSQQYINISEYHIYYKNKTIIMKKFAIIHYHNCLPEHNLIINKNIEDNNYIKLYEEVVIKLMKEIKHHNIKYYDYFITPILKKYNEKTLLPKDIVILTMKYGNDNKILYYILLLQIRKKFSLSLNNLFKLVIQFII